MRAAVSPASTSSSLLASLFGAETQYFDTHERLIDIKAVTNCAQCGAAFGFFSKKLQCPTCRRIVCATCLDDTKYSLPVTAADDDDDTEHTGAANASAAVSRVTVCVLCCKLLQRHHALIEFRRVRHLARELPVVRAYATLRALRSAIDTSMPAFRGLVFSLTGTGEGASASLSAADVVAVMDVDNLFYLQQRACEQRALLERQFRQLEDRLARTQESEPGAPPSDTALRSKIKWAAIDFLRRALPEYKLLAEQLKRFLALPEIAAVVENYAANKARVEAEEAREEQLQRRLAEHKRHLGGKSAASALASGGSSPSVEDKAARSAWEEAPAFLQHAASASLSTTGPPPTSSTSPSTLGTSVPVITMVKPAIVPLQGGVSVTVSGEHLTGPCSVRIGGVLCERVQALPTPPGSAQSLLLVRVPTLRDIGPQSLLVSCGNGQSAELNDVLFATDDPALIADLAAKDQAATTRF